MPIRFDPDARIRALAATVAPGQRYGFPISFVDDDTLQVGRGIANFWDGTRLVLSNASNVTFSALDTGARAVGKDYYIFATADGIVLSEIPQTFPATKQAPSGYDEDDSLLLGWFHNGKDFEGGGADGAIFEYSICDYPLIHRAWNYQYPYRAHKMLPAGIPLPGMIGVGGLAMGIYAASREDATASAAGSSDYPTSRYSIVPWVSIAGWNTMAACRNAGCRLPTWEEWLGAVQWNPGSDTPARMNGNTYYGSASDDTYLAAAGAATVAAGAAGNLTGDYYYKIIFVNTNGETQAGTASALVQPSSQQIDLSAIPIGGAGCTARKIYRTAAGGSTYKYVATISDNTTTVYTDDLIDGSLGANAGGFNTTGAQHGTSDPTHNAGRILTGTGPRTTAWTSTMTGRSWYSPAGLADPVGNIWEWVAQFFGGLKTSSPGTSVDWGHEGDRAYNFEGQSYNSDTGGWTAGLPALLYVGGHWFNGASAGVRAAHARSSPGHASTNIGFRLAR